MRKSRAWYLCLVLELFVIAFSLACAFAAGFILAR